MNEREQILGRIREALAVPAPVPGHGVDRARPRQTAGPPAAQARQWLPAVGSSLEEHLAMFARHATDLRAEFCLLRDSQELERKLLSLRDAEQWKKIATHRGELTDAACPRLGLPICRTDKGYAVVELEACDAGVTECDALVAQTGSIVLTSRSGGGRALSVLPPHHVVLARRDQLVADLPDAFALLKKKYGSDYPSFISFITGPSRTGDIERILVLGAHGPKKLTILCL